ncbi:hypothetical protein J3R83DRAFT_7889 [Lanmaoa asiatica]|nr:hypothetical protein J3R83DRAFT_7889 [Lanmaoa asiatica]
MSGLKSCISEAFPSKPTFKVQDIPDLTGKVIIVTGASTGIGKETARVLLAHGARVYIAARNRAQSEDTIRQLKQETGNEAVFLNLDLANLKAVKAAAEEFLRSVQKKTVGSGSGVMFPPIERLTADGYDLQFGTNVLGTLFPAQGILPTIPTLRTGHHYFTKLLLPTMIATAKTTSDGKTRVVTTSSSGHLWGHLDFDTFKDSPERRKRDTNALYCQSKFVRPNAPLFRDGLNLTREHERQGNVVVALELARQYGDQGIVSTSLNPGNIKSDLQRHLPRFVQTIINHAILYDTSYGALSQLYAGTMPEAAALGGKYLVPWARVSTPLKETQDPELGKKLWDWLEEQVKDV